MSSALTEWAVPVASHRMVVPSSAAPQAATPTVASSSTSLRKYWGCRLSGRTLREGIFARGLILRLREPPHSTSTFSVRRGLMLRGLASRCACRLRSSSSCCLRSPLLDLKTFLVPGNFPIEYVPAYLDVQSNNAEEYDSGTGCIKWLNEFSETTITYF